MSEQPRAVLFTALEVETAAVVAHLREVEAIRWGSEVHQRGRFAEGIGWDVIVVQTEPENQMAATAVQSALTTLEPAVALYVGVAGGFEEQGVAAGDLVIPPTVEYYQAGKAADEFTPRNRQYRCTRYLLGASRQIAREGRWLHRLDPVPDPAPSVHFEPLASGDHVVKSLESETYKLIRAQHDKVVAVDMEASGFLLAAGQHQGVESAVVRGVSDLLSDKDGKRDAKRQPEAARRAAAFAFEILATTPSDVLRICAPPVEVASWVAVAAAEPVDDARPRDPARDDNDVSGVAVELGQQLAAILDVPRWQHQTNGIFFGSPPDMPADFDERLAAALAWIASRVPVEGLEGVLDAIANLGAVIRDFRDVFHKKVELSLNGQHLRVPQFYRQYDIQVSQRERLLVEFEQHVLLIKDLGVEMTRALNLVSERIRALDPRYGVTEGAAGVFAGAEESLVVVSYTEEERRLPRPYPGLAEFEAVLPSRDGSFGPYRSREEEWPEAALGRLEAALEREEFADAQGAAFDFAALVADVLPEGEVVEVADGQGRGHRVRIQRVTVRWSSADGTRVGEPVHHLTRTYVTPRGQSDSRRERLIGVPRPGVVGEVLEAAGSRLLEMTRDADLSPFAKEAHEILERVEELTR